MKKSKLSSSGLSRSGLFRPALFDLFARGTFDKYDYNALLDDIEYELSNALSAFLKRDYYGLIFGNANFEDTNFEDILDSEWVIDAQNFIAAAEPRILDPVVQIIGYDSMKHVAHVLVSGRLFLDDSPIEFSVKN